MKRQSGRAASPAPPRAALGHAVPRLLDAAPIVRTLERVNAPHQDRRALTPSDPVAEALGGVVVLLAAAVEEASDLTLWLDTQTASEILGCEAAHVAHLCRTGRIEAQKVGGEWRVARHAVERREDGV